eukprot:Blabericola_migrator_1__393@NODE_1099_length_5436_cov_762_106165_g752_i0_p2_GENE_NODE_1099_length_5436_cov_762_106165_g752_i0NODE_1099_length_5436_cov_762_106165_g752_i0_p2_ORF_typecomplete_len168_score15_53_NODE_1099_length_5436_cov_762_106165_g752_i026713174
MQSHQPCLIASTLYSDDQISIQIILFTRGQIYIHHLDAIHTRNLTPHTLPLPTIPWDNLLAEMPSLTPFNSNPPPLLSSPPYSTTPRNLHSSPNPSGHSCHTHQHSTQSHPPSPLLIFILLQSTLLSTPPLLHSSQTLLSISADWAHSLHPNTQTYAPSRRLTLSIL